jgi:1-acyl-sn-glycerol-3-phosphate acyltransferase
MPVHAQTPLTAAAEPPTQPIETPDALLGRDPDFVARSLNISSRIVRYFSPEVRGLENVPTTGPALLVGNHSGLMYLPDFWVAFEAVTRLRGTVEPVYMLTYDMLMKAPGVRTLLGRLGAVPASPANAEAGLRQGALVIVYPGGDWEACRSWRERDVIDFNDHKGFVRLALRTGVPVIPMVAHGVQHTVAVIARGDRVAHALRLSRTPLRMNVLPLVIGPPFGIAHMPLATPLPMPATIRVEFLPALEWKDRDPAQADKDEVVDALYAETLTTMRAALDRLRAETPHPLLTGSSHLLRDLEHGVVHAAQRLIP